MKKIFEKWANELCIEKTPIAAHGSNRSYYRLKGKTHACLGALNFDKRENEAFFYYSDFFTRKGFSVPKIYAIDASRCMYLLQDLGNTTLYDFLTLKKQQGLGFDEEMLALYKIIIDKLIEFQFSGNEIDYSYAYPRNTFDSQSMQWDLNYFKYYFLKLAYISFDEQLLEKDYQVFIDYLLTVDNNYFMYRDFQSRNIMLHENEMYFIDYQGGRKGALHYDIASLLFDAKAEIPNPIREELLNYYMTKVSARIDINPDTFRQQFYAFVLLRIMQAMGTYGYRGFYEHKEHFLKSIIPAQENIQWIIDNKTFPIQIPHLYHVWKQIATSVTIKEKIQSYERNMQLRVSVNSFSFKRGYPIESKGNGGGFVFDCRALPNPGRYDEYKNYTGKDPIVIEYLKKQPSVELFLNSVYELVSLSVKNYQERKFTDLQINFGCTGGQHRSVYCAEQLAIYLNKHFNCSVIVHHLEQE